MQFDLGTTYHFDCWISNNWLFVYTQFNLLEYKQLHMCRPHSLRPRFRQAFSSSDLCIFVCVWMCVCICRLAVNSFCLLICCKNRKLSRANVRCMRIVTIACDAKHGHKTLFTNLCCASYIDFMIFALTRQPQRIYDCLCKALWKLFFFD